LARSCCGDAARQLRSPRPSSATGDRSASAERIFEANPAGDLPQPGSSCRVSECPCRARIGAAGGNPAGDPSRPLDPSNTSGVAG
jgi:hypothetical protein